MHFLTTRGAPRERGRQHGEQLRDAVAAAVDAWGSAPVASPTALALLQWLQEHDVDGCAELQGIAEAAGLTFERLVLHNLHNALVHLAQGCTTFIARGEDDSGVLGKTQDVGPVEAEYQLVHHFTDQHGRQAVVVGLVGTIWTVCGLNEDGLAAGINSAPPTTDASRPLGLPQHQALYPLIRDESTVAGALRWWLRTPLVGKGINGCLVDGLGDAVAFERCGARWAVTRATGSLHRTNHYLDPGLAAVAAAAAGADSDERHAHLTRHLAGRRFADPAAAARELLASPPVCRPLAADGCGTWSAYLADPGRQTLWVAHGPPSAVAWHEVRLG